MYRSTVTGKRQITIPKEICILLNIANGNQVTFNQEDDKIIFNVVKEHDKCLACKGSKKIDDKECFICRGTGELEKDAATDIYKLIGLIGMYARKYGVAFSFIQQDFNEEIRTVYYKDFPTIDLISKEYSTFELNRVKDEMQKIIIKQFTLKEDDGLFMVPSDCILAEILDTLVTEDVKEEVTRWFRYDKTLLS